MQEGVKLCNDGKVQVIHSEQGRADRHWCLKDGAG